MGKGDAFNSWLGTKHNKEISSKLIEMFNTDEHKALEYIKRFHEQWIIRIHTAFVTGVEPTGYGDRFAEWCGRFNREVPSQAMVDLLNENEVLGRQTIRADSKCPRVYRALCSFMAGRGQKDWHLLTLNKT